MSASISSYTRRRPCLPCRRPDTSPRAASRYGLKYETAANHPHLFIGFAPWRGAGEHFSLMEGLPSTVPIGVLLRDREGGEVRVGRDGEPVVRYRLSSFDASHMRTGIDGAAQILEAAGARRIFTSHTKWVSYDAGSSSGARARYMADADAAGYGPGQIALGSFHIMGSARMGGLRRCRCATPPVRRGTCGTCTCSTARRSRPRRGSTRRSRSRRSRTWGHAGLPLA